MIYGFPAFAVIVATIAVYFRVSGGGSPALWSLPVAVGILTYLGMRRVFIVKTLPSTTHQYQLIAAGSPGKSTVGVLVEALRRRGYQPEAHLIDEAGVIGGSADPALDLVGNQVRIVDRRADSDAGMVAVRLRRADDGGVLGLIEAIDTGPGIYDEMAQFAIVAVGADVPGVEYVAFGRSTDRRTPESLRGELPEQPLGLALL